MLLNPVQCLIAAVSLALAPFGLSQVSSVPPAGSPATVEIQAGVEAYQRGATEDAISHFEKANDIQPENPEILLMLGSAYANDVVPTLLSPDNLRLANKAVNTLNQLLRFRPDDGYALRELAMVYFNTDQWEKAKAIQERIVASEPSDFEAEYTIGAIDWTIAYRFASNRLRTVNIVPGNTDDSGAPTALCQEIAARNRPLLDDGLHHLRRALELHPGYRDALAYLSLVYKLRAGTDCGDRVARNADHALAAEFESKTANLPIEAQAPVSPQPSSSLLPLPPLPIPPPPPPMPPAPPSSHTQKQIR